MAGRRRRRSVCRAFLPAVLMIAAGFAYSYVKGYEAPDLRRARRILRQAGAELVSTGMSDRTEASTARIHGLERLEAVLVTIPPAYAAEFAAGRRLAADIGRMRGDLQAAYDRIGMEELADAYQQAAS